MKLLSAPAFAEPSRQAAAGKVPAMHLPDQLLKRAFSRGFGLGPAGFGGGAQFGPCGGAKALAFLRFGGFRHGCSAAKFGPSRLGGGGNSSAARGRHAALAGPATMPISLNAIRKQVPDAYDAFWLPNQAMVVVLVGLSKLGPGFTFPSQTSLKVFSPHGQDLGKPAITMSLMDFEGPVMAESATGSNVARWTTELTKIKAQGVVKPLLAGSPPQ